VFARMTASSRTLSACGASAAMRSTAARSKGPWRAADIHRLGQEGLEQQPRTVPHAWHD
jgi:hypothetical protein